jgi:hypothetical protein
VPERGIGAKEKDGLVVRVSVPEFAPTTLGVNAMATLQVAPVATDPQLLVCEKAAELVPSIGPTVTCNWNGLAFVSVMVCTAVEAVPTVCAAKLTLAGLIVGGDGGELPPPPQADSTAKQIIISGKRVFIAFNLIIP